MWERIRTIAGRNLAATMASEAEGAGLTGGATDLGVVTEADIDALPGSGQRFLRWAGVVGRPRDRSFRAHLTGRFRMRQNLPWMPCESWQYNTASPIARIFHMRIDFFHVLPMVGRDIYLDGHGLMHGKVLDLATVMRGEGEEFDIGELTTWLNDAVLIAPSMLLTPQVAWSAVDDDHFDVALGDAGHRVSARVTLDADGAPVDFETTDRFATLPEGLVRAQWNTPVGGWRTVDGRRCFSTGSAVWHLDDGPFEYGRLSARPGDIDFDVPPSG